MAKPTLSKKSCGKTVQRFEQTNSFDRHLPHSAHEAAPPENSTHAPIHGNDKKAKIHRTRQRFSYPTPGLPLFGADRASRAPIVTCKAVPTKLNNARRHRRRIAKK